VLVDKESIAQLKDSIVLHVDDSPHQSSAFVRFSASCHVARATGREGLGGLHRQLVDITRREWDLFTIVLKLDWLRERRDANELDPMVWMLFAANDVNSFLMNVRSLFDHVAKVIRLVSGGQTPQSFGDLRKWVAKDTHAHALEPRLVQLVAGCDWFEDLRRVRDDLMHRAAETVVFPEVPYIGVQITKGVTDRLITEPELLDPQNSNVAIFERFSVASLARIHVLLEDVAHVAQDLWAVPDHADGARSGHLGLAVVARWCDDFKAALNPGDSTSSPG
jgi:hypothetical protein